MKFPYKEVIEKKIPNGLITINLLREKIPSMKQNRPIWQERGLIGDTNLDHMMKVCLAAYFSTGSPELGFQGLMHNGIRQPNKVSLFIWELDIICPRIESLAMANSNLEEELDENVRNLVNNEVLLDVMSRTVVKYNRDGSEDPYGLYYNILKTSRERILEGLVE